MITKKDKIKIFIGCVLIVFGIAFLGSLFTDTGDWYKNNKPSFTPPNYIFPIVWNILFFMIALSLYLSWIGARNKRKKIAVIFGINLFLNALWSFLFFGLKKPGIAFIELIILWITILVMIKITWKIDKKASWLLVPYLLWVSFAGILNLGFI